MWKRIALLLVVGLSACQPAPVRVILTSTPGPTAVPDAVREHEALVIVERDDDFMLAALDMDSGETWILADNVERMIGPGFRTVPALSPDGTTVAFARNAVKSIPGGSELVNNGIWQSELDGSHARQLAVPGENQEFVDPHWSLDGTQIAFENSGFGDGLYVVPVSGGEPAPLIPVELKPSAFEWSPDGTRLLYHSRRFIDAAFQQDGLYIYDLEAGTETQVMSEPKVNYGAPDWSPDGTQITYIRWDTETNLQEIYTANADGSGVVNVTPGQEYAFDPHFTLDGSALAYNHYDTETKVYAVRILPLDASAAPRTLIELPGNRSGPSW